MADFSELRATTVEDHWNRPGRAYVFRRDVPSSASLNDWQVIYPTVFAWAEENGVILESTGQCFFLPQNQKNFERNVLAFMMRWC